MMRVYIAASSKELGRAKAVKALLEDYGHQVTHDWMAEVEKVGSANPEGASQQDLARWASEDLAGVDNADFFWLLMPEDGGLGAFWEAGYAQARGKVLIVSGRHSRSIFTIFAHRYDSDVEAFEAVFADE
jgi:nucleoside 2-deoxyribosyltransferase